MIGQREQRRLATPAFSTVVLSTFAYFLAVGTVLPILPLYIEGPLAGDSATVGLALGSSSFAALALNIWAGRLGDRRGRRVLLVGGAALVGVSILGLLVARSVPVVVFLRLIGGAGDAFFFVGGASAVSDLAPEDRRGEAVSFYSLALHSGLAVGPVLGEALFAGERYWAVWLVAAALAAVAALVGTRLTDTRPVITPGAVATRLLHPAAIPPGLVLIAGALGAAGFSAFVPLYAREIGLSGARFVFMTFSGILMMMRTLGARLPDRLGSITAALLALAGTAVGLGIVGAWRDPVGLFAGTVIFALGHALLFPSLLLLAISRATAHERAAAVGTLTSFLSLAFGAGPAILGLVARTAGYPGAFLVAAGVAACGFILFWRYALGRLATGAAV